jgi:hypothetical protein
MVQQIQSTAAHNRNWVTFLYATMGRDEARASFVKVICNIVNARHAICSSLVFDEMLKVCFCGQSKKLFFVKMMFDHRNWILSHFGKSN